MDDTNNKIWEINIYRSLKDISEIETQRLSWLGKHSTEVSSFTESLGMLYDNFAFEEYLEYYKTKYGMDGLFNSLTELDEMINDYQSIGYALEFERGGLEKILEDPRWIKITKKALDIIHQWNKG